MTLNRAHRYAKRANNDEDKIERIYINEIKRQILSSDGDLPLFPHVLTILFYNFTGYEIKQSNIDKSRICANLAMFLRNNSRVKSYKMSYDEEFLEEGKLELEVPDRGNIRQVYEVLILNHEMTEEEFVNFFLEDLTYLYTGNNNYFSDIAKYIYYDVNEDFELKRDVFQKLIMSVENSKEYINTEFVI